MVSVKEALDKMDKAYWFGAAYNEAKRCRNLWQDYQERPSMFTFEEWHESLLRWNRAVARYEYGSTSA